MNVLPVNYSFKKSEKIFFFVLAVFAPVSSVLLIPAIQGTTVANILLMFLFVPFVSVLVFDGSRTAMFWRQLFWLLSLYFLLTIPPAVYAGYYRLPDVSRFPPGSNYSQPLSYILQTVYVVMGMAIFSFVRIYKNALSEREMLFGAVFVCVYGLYEFFYFLIFKSNGDFLSNRVFALGLHSGSWLQTINIGGVALARIKSLTGEPSMFALTILPFFSYALIRSNYLFAALFGISLLFTFSTAAYIGIVFVLLYFSCFKKNFFIVNSALVFFVVAFFAVFYVPEAHQVFEKVVLSKLDASSHSGDVRARFFAEGLHWWIDAGVFTKLFGVGFGTVRTTDLFSTLLINVGVVGVFAFLLFLFYPIFKLRVNAASAHLVCSVLVVVLVMFTAVPEYSYLTSWIFFGLLYSDIDRGAKSEG